MLLLHKHWLFLFGAFALGIVFGWLAWRREAAAWRERPVFIGVALVALGAIVAIAATTPGRWSGRLEFGVVLAVLGAAGYLVGKALRDLAEFTPAATRAGATASAGPGGSYLFRDAFGTGGGGAYLRTSAADGIARRPPIPSDATGWDRPPAAGGYTFPATRPFADATASRPAARGSGLHGHWSWPRPAGSSMTPEFAGSKGGYIFPAATAAAPPADTRAGTTPAGQYKHWSWRSAAGGTSPAPGGSPAPGSDGTGAKGAAFTGPTSEGTPSPGGTGISSTDGTAQGTSLAAASGEPGTPSAPPGAAPSGGPVEATTGVADAAQVTDSRPVDNAAGAGAAPGASPPRATRGPAGPTTQTAAMPAGPGASPPQSSQPATGPSAGDDRGAPASPASLGPDAADRVPASEAVAIPTASASVDGPPATTGDTDAGGSRETGGGLAASTSAPPAGPAAGAPSAPGQPATIAAVPGEDQHAGERPVGLMNARDDRADDLKRIRGIGPQNERRLNGLGIWHFDQIAAWTPDNVRWVGSYLAFPGRIDRENWLDQARALVGGTDTIISRRLAAGNEAASLEDGSAGPSNVADATPRPRRPRR